MISKRSLLLVVVAVVLLAGLNAPLVLAQCKSKTAAVKQLDQLRQGRSLSIRLFSIAGSTIYKAEPLENLRIALAERLREELQASKYFSSVVILPEDKQPQSDLVLEGGFTEIDEGNRAGRILSGSGEARLGIRGKLVTTKTSETAFEFECFRATAGGPLGTGGWLAGSGKKLIHDLIEDLAESLKKVIPEFGKKVEKLAEVSTNTGNANLPPIAADKGRRSDLPEKSLEQWSWKDCLKVLSTFSIFSKPKSDGFVSAHWLTVPSYQANLRLLDIFLSQKKILERLSQKKFAEELPQLKEHHLSLQELIKKLEKEDIYLLGISFNKRKNPIYWDQEKVNVATFLTQSEHPNERIQPLQIINSPPLGDSYVFRIMVGDDFDNWATNSVLLVFPVKLADGRPLIESLNDRFELHTEFESRPVVITLDLKRFGLKRIEELKLKPEATATEKPPAASRQRSMTEKPPSR